MAPAFWQGVAEQLPNAAIAVDGFHIVQIFTRSVDEVRKLEGKEKPLPNHLRWAVLKRGELDHLTTSQLIALTAVATQGLDTATAWRVKEKLAWVRKALTPRAARWRITHFLNWA
jgi:transposase